MHEMWLQDSSTLTVVQHVRWLQMFLLICGMEVGHVQSFSVSPFRPDCVLVHLQEVLTEVRLLRVEVIDRVSVLADWL